MTLTIAAVNSRAAFLSSDFRLTATKTSSGPFPASPKLLQVSRRKLDALVAYCGVGSIGTVQTNDWLSEEFRSSASKHLEDTLEQIRAAAARFVSRVRREDRTLTVVVTGVSEGRTFLAVISNYEHLDRTTEGVRDEFAAELAYPDETQVFVPCGWSANAAWRRVAGRGSEVLLKAVSRGKGHPQRVIVTMAELTKQVAESPDSGGLVSPQCHAGYMLTDRTGATRVFGSINEELNPHAVMDDQDFAEQARQIFSKPHLVPKALVSCETYTPRDGWLRTADLRHARHQHSATVLGDGRVLVAGGKNDAPTEIRDVELFNAKDDWEEASPMKRARAGHRGVLLRDGRVLVIGGWSSDTRSCELFDPRINSWSDAAPLRTGRSNHTTTLLGDGRALVVGGTDEKGRALRSTELYDPVTDKWSSAKDIALQRFQHAAVRLGDGRILIAGGNKGTNPNPVLREVEIFDAATLAWKSGRSMTLPRHGHEAILLPNGLVLVVGGTQPTETYDAQRDEWAPTVNAGSLRSGGFRSLDALKLGVIVTGGQQVGTGSILSEVESFEPGSMAWSPIAKMNQARNGHAVALLHDDRILVAGGLEMIMGLGLKSLRVVQSASVSFGER